MSSKTLTRADLCEVVYHKVGLSARNQPVSFNRCWKKSALLLFGESKSNCLPSAHSQSAQKMSGSDETPNRGRGSHYPKAGDGVQTFEYIERQGNQGQ